MDRCVECNQQPSAYPLDRCVECEERIIGGELRRCKSCGAKPVVFKGRCPGCADAHVAVFGP